MATTTNDNLVIAQVANALFGVVVGKTTNDAVLASITQSSLDATLNNYYTTLFTNTGVTTATVATNMLANLGITIASVGSQTYVDAARSYIENQLNAAHGTEGAAISGMLSLWSGLATDAVYGKAATAWNTTITAAEAYTSSGALVDKPITQPAPAQDQTFNINAAGTTANPSTNDTFNIAAGTYTHTISGFNAGDKIVFFAGASINIVPNTNTTDGQVNYTATDPVTGNTTTITIAGLSATQDAAIFNVPSFNTVFGAGSMSAAAASTGPNTTSGATFNINAAGTTTNPLTNDTFNIASGNYTATLNGFNAGDKIVFFTGASINIVPNTNTTDGQVSYAATDPATGNTATLTITGLTSAQDAAIFNVPSFNTVFGAGSMT